MALQLPAEFPLGLVFVVGKVRNLTNADGEGGPTYFYIAESEHMLRCQLTERALEGIQLSEGDMIRAGGHLSFDTLQANYFLLARDIEILPERRPSRTMLAPILSDIKKRSKAASLAPAELPDWVQQMAPPELQGEKVDETALEPEEDLEDTAERRVPEALLETASEVETANTEQAELLPGGFTDDLVEFLSEAMDSPEDVELTHDMVAELAPAIRPEEQARMKAAQPGRTVVAQSDSRIPWAIVLVVLFFLVSFLGLILVMALLATR